MYVNPLLLTIGIFSEEGWVVSNISCQLTIRFLLIQFPEDKTSNAEEDKQHGSCRHRANDNGIILLFVFVVRALGAQ